MNRNPMVPVGQVLSQVYRVEPVLPDGTYKMLGVRWYAAGAFIKAVKKGFEIQARELLKVKEGDLLYNRLFAWKGSFAIIGPTFSDCYVSNEFPVFQVDTNRADPSYLLRYFSQPAIWSEMQLQSTGGTPLSRNRLKGERFLSMNVPLPDLHEQRRI